MSLDASVIDLCATMFDWAKFRLTKGAVKLHLLLDHDGYLPSFAVITEGKKHEVRVARQMRFTPGTILVFDREIVQHDLSDLSAIEARLSGYDACFFCLGVSAVGMNEEAYRRLTYDLTVSVARTLGKLNPTMTFIYVSGAGTDSTERGRIVWARVKGRTENALLQMGFKAAYLFRPAYIQPLHGIRTKTAWYGTAYALMRPLYPLLKMLLPNYVTTTECVGRAMLNVTKRGFPKPVLENRDINNMCAKDA
jgi:hypothetical protein